jgi:hypothetical protein
MSLDSTALRAKIKTVEIDIENLNSQGLGGRQLEILAQYKEYLEDELRMLEDDENSKRS